MSTKLADYSFSYPEELVATTPLENRSASRLMALDRKNKSWQHQNFRDICQYFSAGDVLVLNDSRVFPCRLITQRASGGKQEFVLLRSHHEESNGRRGDLPSQQGDCRASLAMTQTWEVLANAKRKLKIGDEFQFDQLKLSVTEIPEDSETVFVKLDYSGDLLSILDRIAEIPLPPYMNRREKSGDRERYQTVYAAPTGSTAAPTAGLHFTPEILQQLEKQGVIITKVTLHVGPGTFLPVRVDDLTQHKMHAEWCEISQQSAQTILSAKKAGHKITAVGTTALRTLESAARHNFPAEGFSGWTDLFVYPPYEFQIVDQLITNFHQPESTLLMLVSAFAGREFVLNSYQEAITQKYRLFSYGDCQLIL